ncbi:MAG: D-alanyl-D-alanine carboxypeptidase family protein [Lachnospiraceae bacterium]
MKTILAVFFSLLLCAQNVCGADVKEDTQISAPSAVLMEASTGQILFEKNANEELPPASVTKIMTLLLIFDGLESGKITLEDSVTVSEYAASMGGSQVFFEPGEVQSVDTMIKCIAVASGNDAAVAMAEHLCGSEEEFVRQMNERAKGLSMTHTHFQNCNGLDADGHTTTARDIGVMSRELITKYPQIHQYSTIWMENITHTTKKGTTEFGLTNTNKLLRQYQYATGLKTGSTSQAKYCVSATAKKDGMELIAVIMAAPDYKIRFKDATTLLNYGFGKCVKYEDANKEQLDEMEVRHGIQKTVKIEAKVPFSYIDITGADLSAVKKKTVLSKGIQAPVKKGAVVGEIQYALNDKKIGAVDIITRSEVKAMTYASAFSDILTCFLL